MKKLFALLLAIALMATLSVTAFAAEYDTTGDKGMNVTYSVNPGYTVTIPETVTIGANGTSATVSAEGVVVEKGQYVSVTLAADNNFTVKTTEGAELTYTVTANSENVAPGGEILAVNPTNGKTGIATITFDIDESAIQYAGTYTGSATFTIAVKDVPKTIINFTIDGTSYQAEAGMTWAEWVADPAYNTVGLEKDGEWYIVDPSTHKAVFKGEWETCNPSDVIVADYEYYLGWRME
jgi:hypothetical protein